MIATDAKVEIANIPRSPTAGGNRYPTAWLDFRKMMVIRSGHRPAVLRPRQGSWMGQRIRLRLLAYALGICGAKLSQIVTGARPSVLILESVAVLAGGIAEHIELLMPLGVGAQRSVRRLRNGLRETRDSSRLKTTLGELRVLRTVISEPRNATVFDAEFMLSQGSF
jgi:hypothetical protein